MKLTKNVEYILDTIEKAGARADIVGGPVRDHLLGHEPSDYDITTSATPEEVKEIFRAHHTVDTGIKHGTVSLILDGEQYEITTYRVDGEYKDFRHPESVSFTTRIEDDLARRDFTVNAMAYSKKYGLTDVFGGREDLKNGIIRAVGDPHARFSEDALRILRAIRFSSVLDFEIEKNTAQAARELSHLLSRISAERIYTEWTKILSGKNAYAVISKYKDIIAEVLPELEFSTLPDEKRFFASAPDVRHLALFASLANGAESFDTAMRRLRSSTAVREDGATVLSSLGKYTLSNKSDVGLALYELDNSRTAMLARLEFLLGGDDNSEEISAYLASGRPYRLSDLEIGGTEIAKIGARGKEIGAILNALMLDVIYERCENTKIDLISRAEDKLSALRG